MISLCNNTYEFFDKHDGPIVIYGAGNSGEWIGKYMRRCGMDFICYIDQKAEQGQVYLNDKPVYTKKKIIELCNESIRIIISPHNYGEIVTDLLLLKRKNEINALCLVPRCYQFIERKDIYHINKLLAYFRKKLFTGSVPTIISNDCVGGEIYDYMDMIMISPTINTWIDPDDFVKLCTDPHRYLEIEVQDSFMNIYTEKDKRTSNITPAIRLDDITIYFAHTSETDNVVERWNTMRKKINWDNMIFVFRSYELPVPQKLEELAKNNKKILLIRISGNTRINSDIDYLLLERNVFSDYGRVIDNYFDLTEWMNEACR